MKMYSPDSGELFSSRQCFVCRWEIEYSIEILANLLHYVLIFHYYCVKYKYTPLRSAPLSSFLYPSPASSFPALFPNRNHKGLVHTTKSQFSWDFNYILCSSFFKVISQMKYFNRNLRKNVMSKESRCNNYK